MLRRKREKIQYNTMHTCLIVVIVVIVVILIFGSLGFVSQLGGGTNGDFGYRPRGNGRGGNRRNRDDDEDLDDTTDTNNNNNNNDEVNNNTNGSFASYNNVVSSVSNNSNRYAASAIAASSSAKLSMKRQIRASQNVGLLRSVRPMAARQRATATPVGVRRFGTSGNRGASIAGKKPPVLRSKAAPKILGSTPMAMSVR